MSITKKKRVAFFAVAIVCIMSCVAVCFPLFAQNSTSSDSKLTSLLEERREVLITRVEMIEKLVVIAKSTPEALIAARDDLFDAEIEMATNSSERVEALQRKLENAKQFESVMQQRKRDARGTEAEVLMAKAGQLGIEIELLRETRQQAGSK